MLDRESRAEKNAYHKLLQSCSKIDSKCDKHLISAKNFDNLSQEISEKIEEFKNQISKTPLVALVLLWATDIKSTDNLSSNDFEMMNELIEKKLLPLQNGKHILSLSEISKEGDFFHYAIIDAIRCCREWSFEKQENYIGFYCHFINWLSKVTLGFIVEASDMDRMVTKGRFLKFETYIKIVNGLSLRDRIIAKICYLGGSRPLEEIFLLKIEEINFKEWTLKLGENYITYPQNLLVDLKEYIGSRKKGYVFVNREGDPVDVTVPYRALKTVVKKLDLDKSFTFKDFMKSS